MKPPLRLALLLLLTFACTLPNALLPPPTITPQPPPTPTPVVTLRTLAERHDLLIGVCSSWGMVRNDPVYADLLVRQYNVLTHEGALLFRWVHPEPDRYDFADADALVDFAEANGMAVRGHVLVWDFEPPEWLTEREYSRQELKDILRDHIHTLVGHYRGRVFAWNVVNEAFTEEGALRDTIWLRGIGPEYIALAFQWAHEADPEALLFYNEHRAEGFGPKSEAVYLLAKGLKEEGIPIHGVGFQMHIALEDAPSPQDVAANMERLGALGLQVHITEMDVRIGPETTADKLEKQAQLYADMLSVCLAAENCNVFMMWGLTDRYSWIPWFFGHADAPLIFDTDYRPKPAYEALFQLLSDQ